MTHYTLKRDRDRPLTFVGNLLAGVSTRHRRDRWTELRLYRTSDTGYVCEQVGRTLVEGEMDRSRAWPCRDFDEIREALGDGPLARQLYLEAGFYGADRVGPETTE